MSQHSDTFLRNIEEFGLKSMIEIWFSVIKYSANEEPKLQQGSWRTESSRRLYYLCKAAAPATSFAFVSCFPVNCFLPAPMCFTLKYSRTTPTRFAFLALVSTHCFFCLLAYLFIYLQYFTFCFLWRMPFTNFCRAVEVLLSTASLQMKWGGVPLCVAA